MSATSAQPVDRQRQQQPIAPRILRATKEAPAYLGMCRNVFNEVVRPHLREIPIGKQGVGFDRRELDAWVDASLNDAAIDKAPAGNEYVSRSGRQGVKEWREKPSRVSTKETASGTSTKCSEAIDFKRALALAKGRKRSST